MKITAILSGYGIHTFVYRQHKFADEDRGSWCVTVVQWCMAGTASDQGTKLK